MLKHRLAAVATLAFFLVGGVFLADAMAGAPPPPGTDLDDSQLDALRERVPEGFPGEFDEEEASVIYDEIAGIVGGEPVDADVAIGSGSELLGVCGGFAWSYDKNGDRIDAAYDAGDGAPPVDIIDGGQAFTSSNRFKVDTEGIVQYYGFMPRSGDGPENHTWEIKTGGISVDSGGDPNEKLKNRASGLVDLADDMPVKFSANTQITGKLSSANIGQCVGEGHVEFIGPFFGPVGIAALALFGGGILGLLFNARPAMTFRAGG